MKVTTIGLDIAKQVFALYWMEADSGEIKRRTLKRSQMLMWFGRRERCVVAMEACGSAHYWARMLLGLGYEVKLIAPKFVRAFVQANKTDAADAQAIWEASRSPSVRPVAVKSETQQAVLGLHRMREQLIKMRSMHVNQLRGLVGEFGVQLPSGRVAGMKQLGAVLAESAALPELLRPSLQDQLTELRALDERIAQIERTLAGWAKTQPACARLDDVPGVGELIATAAVASMGEPKRYGSGRGFAASLGLVPAQSGTGGKVKLLKISKRGDRYLRSLLIHGARAVLSAHRRKSAKSTQHHDWLSGLLARRPFNVAVVALANKIARTIWALAAYERSYDPHHRCQRPA
jgi:transposase